MGKTALIIGATGLVGGQLLNQILNDDSFSSIKIFVRRSSEITHPKLQEYIIDFNALDKAKGHIKGDVLFSCLGTTLKQAGSKAKQYKVDYTYQCDFAKLAAENGVKEYFLVSSAGANAGSSFFYPRIKGELEVAVSQFSFESIRIIQPSLLLGSREKKRTMEQVSAKLLPFVIKVFPGLKKYKGIKGAEVAAAMLNISKSSFNKRVEVFTLNALFNYVN